MVIPRLAVEADILRVAVDTDIPRVTMPRGGAAASASVLLLQKATTKRQQQALRDAFKVWSSWSLGSRFTVKCSINCQKADKNGDGKLSYEEYWNVVKRSGVP